MFRILLAIIGFLLAWPASAQDQKNNRSLLWKITGRNMQQPSYLFGTIHLICPSDYLWTAKMSASLRSCKEVCFEMDMDDPTVPMKIAMGMIDSSGKTLKDYFTEADFSLLERFMQDSLGLNLSVFMQMKPSALQSLLAIKSVDCDNPESYEGKIMDEAKSAGLEVGGLESPEEQIALLDRLGTDSSLQEMIATIRDYRAEKEKFDLLIQAYKKQDLPGLHQLMSEATSLKDDLTSFLDERNIRWIARMEDKMDLHPVFFAVGAGHLWGTNGVITLLRQAGYTVTPVW